MWVAGREEGFGEGDAEVNGEPSEAAGVSEKDAGFGFGDGLAEIVEVTVEFAGGVEAAELESHLSGTVSERAGVLKVLGGLGGIVRQEESG
jgi:hypothetical protein